MTAVLDIQKFTENLRRLFVLPTNVMHHATIDQDRFSDFGDDLFVNIVVTQHVIVPAHEPLPPTIIPPTANLVCSLQKAISDQDIVMAHIINALDMVLQNVPIAIRLPSADQDLLGYIDCDAITDENQLPDLEIPLVAIHKSTQWLSLTNPISLRFLYFQQALNELWAQSKTETVIQFREFF